MCSRFYIVLLLILNLFAENLAAFAPPLTSWTRCFGGAGLEVPYQVLHSRNGNYYSIGSSASQNGTFMSNHGSDDIWLISFDSTGTLLWEKNIGGSGSDVGTGLVELPNGNLVICGYSTSSDDDLTVNRGFFDAWLISTDASGNILWTKSYGGSQSDMFYSVALGSDSSLLVGGATYSNDGDISGGHGDEDFWMLKTDLGGNLIWGQVLGGTRVDICFQLKQNNSGEIIACGTSNSIDGDVSGSRGNYDFWVVAVSLNGTVDWKKCFGGTLNDCAFSLTGTSTGSTILTGYSKSSDGDLTQNHGYTDTWVLEIDSSGNILRQHSFGGNASDMGFSVIQTIDGGFAVASGSTSANGNVSNNFGQEDTWILKLDNQLNIEWEKSYGGSSGDRPCNLVQTSDAGFIVCSSSLSHDFDVNGNQGSSDFWIMNLSCRVPQAGFNLTSDSVCAGAHFFPSNTSVNSSVCNWTVNGISLSNQFSPDFQFGNSGMITLQLEVETCYESDSVNRTIDILPIPEPAILASRSYVCSNDSIQLTSDPGDSYLWNTGATTAVLTVDSGGMYSVTVTIDGCSGSSAMLAVQQYSAPSVNLGNDTSICSGTTLSLNGPPSMNSYLWQDGSTNATLIVSQAGWYSLKVNDGFCENADSIHIDTLWCATPIAGFTAASTSICEHDSVTFADQSQNATAWSWNFPGGNPSTSDDQNPTIIYDVAGRYDVMLSVTNINGSQAKVRMGYIVVHAAPAVPIVNVSGNLLTSSPATTYQWSFNNIPIPGATQQALFAMQTGSYSVTVSDSTTCDNTSIPVYIVIAGTTELSKNNSVGIYPVPFKDLLHLDLNGISPDEIRIYSMTGELVFQMLNPQQAKERNITLELTSLTAGCYSLQLISYQNMPIQKLIIKQ